MARALVCATALGLGMAVCAPAFAQQDPAAEAGDHYKAGVSLFRDGNARAALIEFRRANELLPDPNVQFNIGQCYIALQDYVQALSTLEKVLREGGDKLRAGNKEQALKDVETLKGRIARIEIRVNVTGAEILIDDNQVGTAPLTGPITVSSGRRKVTARLEGREAPAQYVEIAGGELLPVELVIPEAGKPVPVPVPNPEPGGTKGKIPWAGWGVTAGLAAGAAIFGPLALKFSGDLKDAKERATTTEELDRLQSKALGFAVTADIMWGGAVLAGVVSLGVTIANVSSSGSGTEPATKSVTLDVNASPQGVALSGTF